MTRYRAASIHLGISIIVASGVLAVMLLYWYPPAYFSASGADGLLKLVILVDITIGPLLTLLVFRSGKPGLKFDLRAIALMQLAALIYGMSVVWIARPVYLVFVQNQFHLVFAKDFDQEQLEQSVFPEFRTLPRSGPRLVGAQAPLAGNDISQYLSALASGSSVELLPRNFVPYQDVADAAVISGQSLEQYLKRHPDQQALIEAHLADHQLQHDEIVVLPLLARGKALHVVLRRSDGTLVSVFSTEEEA